VRAGLRPIDPIGLGGTDASHAPVTVDPKHVAATGGRTQDR